MNLTAFQTELFARGARMGFTDMEIYHQTSEKFTCSVFQGELDEFTVAGDGGLAFRGLWQGKMGYAYTEKIDLDAIDGLLTAARAGAEIVDALEAVPIFAGSDSYPAVNLWSDELQRTTPAEKAEWLKALERECMRLDPRVKGFNWCSFGSTETQRTIANTKGLARSERSISLFLALMLMVTEGEETRTATTVRLARSLPALDLQAIARELVSEALSYLGARPVASGVYPVVLRGTAAASLLTVFSNTFFADWAQKGRSRLAGRVGEAIAGANITLIDDPLLPSGFASHSFDSEGVAARTQRVVDGGVLQTLLHNLKTAQVDGVESTGHGHKPSYKGALSVSASNFYLQPGDQTLPDLLRTMQDGVLITDLQGLHAGANPISGDFTLACHGYLVQGGQIARPVDQITVAGNFFDLLNGVTAIGSDLAFWYPEGAYCGAPSILVQGLTIAGT